MHYCVALIALNFHVHVEFRSNVLFKIYLVSPASFLSGENLAPICDVLESWYSKEIHEI